MTDEFDGTETDQAWVALTANDPARQAPNPDLAAIKTSIFSEAAKVAPISKRSWLAPVAVAASVALFVGGGAGYTIAAQSASDSPMSIAAPAPDMGAPSSVQDSKMSSALSGSLAVGRAYLEAESDITDDSGTQVGYTFDASDVDRKTELEQIANTFSVKGKITGSKKDGYFVGDPSYANPVAQVSGASWDLSQLITWNYSDASVNPNYCGGDKPMYDNSISSKDGSATSEPMPTSSNCTLPKGILPSDESALALAKEMFGALNFASENAAWSVVDNGGMWGYGPDMAGAYKLVTAKVFVDGFNSNQSWGMVVGPDNSILNANGFFAKFVPTAEYKIIGAKTAIARSQSGLWVNLPPQEVYKDGMIYPMEQLALGGNPSAVAKNSAGQPILSANIDRVKISKAESSLMYWYLNDGSAILLPAYLVSESNAEDSRQWLQLAIADEYVDFN